MSEKDCLTYCYAKEYTWIQNDIILYDILDRVSCWCCSNKNIKELRNYKKYLPIYFKNLILLTETIIANATNDKLKDITNKFLIKLRKIEDNE